MSRYDHAFTHMFASLEKQIADTDNPRHRAILKNYRELSTDKGWTAFHTNEFLPQ